MSFPSSEPSPGHGWSPQQWQAVSSPHRLQIMVLMAGLKQATVQELAELSGRTAQSLYPHLEALVAAQFRKRASGPARTCSDLPQRFRP
jgi:hypothetical protein